jgi:hypothetical protein
LGVDNCSFEQLSFLLEPYKSRPWLQTNAKNGRRLLHIRQHKPRKTRIPQQLLGIQSGPTAVLTPFYVAVAIAINLAVQQP